MALASDWFISAHQPQAVALFIMSGRSASKSNEKRHLLCLHPCDWAPSRERFASSGQTEDHLAHPMDGQNFTHNCSGYLAHDLSGFKRLYGIFHVYLCFAICPAGVITNILNVIVLNQKSMRSPTNLLLTALAVSDGLIMAFYLPFNAYFLLGKHLVHSPYPWVAYLFFYLVLQNCLHAFSFCIIVALSIFRLIYSRSTTSSQVWCSVSRVKLAVTLSILISLLLSIPYFMFHRIVPAEDAGVTETGAPVYYRMNLIDNAVCQALLFWHQAIVLKLLPVLLLSCLSALIIHALRRVEEKKRTLLAKTKDKTNRQTKRTSRTTKMLLIIVVIFIGAYLPQVRTWDWIPLVKNVEDFFDVRVECGPSMNSEKNWRRLIEGRNSLP